MNSKGKEVLSQRLEPAAGVLYVVGTPIGNLGDLSPRARSLLKNVSAIACEDTRHSGQLVRSLDSKASLFSFHKHNTKSRLPKLLSLLQDGQSLALISDAGLPGISDPGEELVSAAKIAGHEVICIPGPCAALTALVSSGLPCDKFCFEGFLPAKGKERQTRLRNISIEARTTIIYESPHRLIKLLEELISLCGVNRPLQVARELTKRHEQQVGPNLEAALKHFLEHQPLGECTVILGGASEKENELYSKSLLMNEMKDLMDRGLSASEAAREISKSSGFSRRTLYNMLHKEDRI